jgi:hypothetical protein
MLSSSPDGRSREAMPAKSGPYRDASPEGSAHERTLVHRPERFWRIPVALLLVLAPLCAAADIFGATCTLRCSRAGGSATCRTETSSVLRPRRYVGDASGRAWVLVRRLDEHGLIRSYEIILSTHREELVKLGTYLSLSLHEPPAETQTVLNDFLYEHPSFTVTFGSPWLRAPSATLALLMALVAAVWALRRTRVTVDPRSDLVRIERVRWPLRRGVHTIARRELRWVTIEGTKDGGVRLALDLATGVYLPLEDFRPTPERAPAERDRLEAFLQG